MSVDSEFTNPERLPVEQLSLSVKSDGVVRAVKALDRQWVEQREWRLYWRLPGAEDSTVGALAAWTCNAGAILNDLKFLLSLRHHRFWSHMVHEPRCMDMLVSFLQEAQPPYLDQEPAPPPIYHEIYRRVASIFCRLVTERESDLEWMTREYLGKLIYNEYLFSIPTLWDLSLLFGGDNPQAIGRLVRAVFTLQPRYNADLETAISFVQEVFKYTIAQVNHRYDGTLVPPNLPETFQGFGEIKRPQKENHSPDKMTLSVLKDLVLHLLDSSLTIRTFTEVYPPAVEALKKRNFILSIVQLYENGIPYVYEKVEELCEEGAPPHAELLSRVETLRDQLVDTVREVLAAETHAVLTQQSNREAHVSDYFSAMMDVLSERLFIRDYNAAYPVHEDLEMLRQAYPDMDSVKIDFILQAVYSNLDEPAPAPVVPVAPEPAASTSTSTVAQPTERQSETPESEIPNNLKEESLISEVKDILPHLGEGFILKCLQHYGFKTERVINSVLEGSLDPSLRSLDQSLPIIPEDALDRKFLETGIERLNIFDGDEFDIMSRDDVDVSRIHVGKKKDKFKNMKQMLNDKSHVRQMTDIYSKYNLVAEDASMYSDEYDDTYDSAAAAASERDDTHDRQRRPLVKPRVLEQMEQRSEESEEEATDEAPQASASSAAPGRSTPHSKPLDFCVNPELLRERREAQRGAAHKSTRPPPKAGDVVGKAKGQGQEKEVLVNRDRKNQHKSSRANHNRRQGAQWKRTQGMMPS